MPFSGEEVHSCFQEWWFKVFLTSSGNSKRKRYSSSDQTIQRDEVLSSLKPKVNIVRSQKPLRPPTNIAGVRAAISVTPISIIPIQSLIVPAKDLDEVRLTLEPSPVTACRRKLKSIVVCTPDEQGMSNVQGSKLNYRKTIFPPPNGAENIMDIFDCDLSPTECMGENGDMNFKEKMAHVFVPPGISIFNIDAIIREVNKSGAQMIGQVILDKVFLTPFKSLHCLKGKFDSLYDFFNGREGDATPLKNKAERLIHQARNLKDLQVIYSYQITTEVRGSRRIEVDGKLNKASHQLDTENTRYNALKAKLGQVEFRREELLKELQSLDDQKKDLSCQVVASEDLLQEVEWAVIDLKGQIDTLNAIEVIDPTSKASLEKIKTNIKESFEDLNTFQWTP
ncbi:hypothetical protein Cgig2_010634 [Carnegiea gigantea]|uniref:Uncharacterized protein n=1 Tax=Carnegiea gigantea TaxID=171969 RepID=A0A9Q1JGC5_9CARY|nr:hypothetical protein Cgig2_010634 [Carnegiea gigantea]